MLRDHLSARSAALVAAVGFLVMASEINTPLPGQCGGGGHAGHGARASSDHGKNHGACHISLTGQPSIFQQPPHGGQVAIRLPYFFEVVYEPQQTHVYLYGTLQESLPADGVRGEVVLQPHYVQQAFHQPLIVVTPPPDSGEPSHLVADADARLVPDGQMTATFVLENLPLRHQPQAAFTQTFALTRPASPVVVAALAEADRPGVERQQVCPVTRARLGSMGEPIKVLLKERPLYLCCEGCVAKVRENPQTYFVGPAAVQPVQSPSR